MSKKISKQEQKAPMTIQEHERPVPMMYCGPGIPGVVTHGMLFSALPSLLLQDIAQCAAIKSFIVAPKEYVKVKQEAERKGSLLYIQRQRVLEYLQRR